MLGVRADVVARHGVQWMSEGLGTHSPARVPLRYDGTSVGSSRPPGRNSSRDGPATHVRRWKSIPPLQDLHGRAPSHDFGGQGWVPPLALRNGGSAAHLGMPYAALPPRRHRFDAVMAALRVDSWAGFQTACRRLPAWCCASRRFDQSVRHYATNLWQSEG